MDSKTRPGRCDKRGAPAQGIRVWELVRRVLFGGVERSPGASPGARQRCEPQAMHCKGLQQCPGSQWAVGWG
jgi:hypothetical protein